MDMHEARRLYERSLIRLTRIRRLATVRVCRASRAEMVVWGLVSLELLIFAVGVVTPPLGRLVPVGRGVVQALALLDETPSGRRLIRDVRRASRGDFIYLTLGETSKDRLYDGAGREVRGVTRAVSLHDGRRYAVRHVTVITNRDITGAIPQEIVKSLAFELENVVQIYRKPWAMSGMDSPMAPITQRRVLNELSYR